MRGEEVRLPATPGNSALVSTRAASSEPGRELDVIFPVTHGRGGEDGALQGLWAAGIRSMLVEGGGELVGSLMAASVVDRVYWIQAPLWLGKGRSAFGDRPATPLTDAGRWTVVERRPLGEDTLLVVDRAPCLPES